MKRIEKTIIAILLPLSLSACGALSTVPGMDRLVGEEGVFRDRQGEYLEAETIPRLSIPDGLDSYVINDLLQVPELMDTGGEPILEVPRPRPISGNPERAVVIQRLGDRSWVIVDASASQVWPRIRRFWEENGIGLSNEDPTRGILETGWFIEEGNTGTREKIRITVQPGFQDDSAEISLLHLSAPQSVPINNEPDWPESSSSTEFEFEILSRLSRYLADLEDIYQASTVSLLAGNISTEGRASIVSEDGLEILRLGADYQRSWAAIGSALDRAGVEVVDEDIDAGYYEVSFNVEEDDTGILDRLFIFGGNEIDTIPFLVRLLESGPVVDVFVEDVTGTDASNSPSAESAGEVRTALLQLIRDYIN